jgi:hypothetical protein
MPRPYGPFSRLLLWAPSLPLPGLERLVLTQIRASRFADPDMLAKEAAFGSPVEVARDLVAFGF